MNSTTPVPVELLDMILRLADRSDLPALCRVNSTFRRHAADLLYRSICTRSPLAVCHTLSTAPDLAARVRRFEIVRTAAFSRMRHSYALVSDALRCMTHLRELRLMLEGTYAWILRPCSSKLALTEFSCNANQDADLVYFLNHQRDITELSLASTCNGFRLDASALPKLSSVAATPLWLSLLVPGRPVEKVVSLERLRSWTDNRFELGFLAGSTVPIHTLVVTASALRNLFSTCGANVLAGLTDLSLREQENVISGEDDDAILFQQSLADILALLPSLRRLSLTYEALFGAPEWPEAQMRMFAQRMAERAPALKEVCTAMLAFGRSEMLRINWKRDGEGEWVVAHKIEGA